VNSATDKTRLAAIGAGVMGSKHAQLICADESCTLVGICDIDPAKKAVADSLGVPFYATTEELLEQQKPAGAIVATPNASHTSVARTCAERSVHALVEKPVADTLQGAQQIVQAARSAGTRVLVGHHRRHNPFVLKTRQLVRDGSLGQLIGVSVLWALTKADEYFDVEWRREPSAGGPTLINLIHEFDSLRFICGEVTEVYAHMRSDVRSLDVEDSLSISLCLAGGVLGTVLASDACPSPWSYEATTGENPLYFHMAESCYRFLGSSGSLAFPAMELWRYPEGQAKGWQHPMERVAVEVESRDPLEAQLQHFCRVIAGEEEPLIDAGDGARSLAVALAVHQSAASGVPVDPSTLRAGSAP